MRVPGGPEPLDGTRVHPESYDAAREILRAAGVDDAALRALVERGGGLSADIVRRVRAAAAGSDAERACRCSAMHSS